MLYVGIDIAKNKHECCIIDTNGETVVAPFSIHNDIKGFNQLAQVIKSCADEYGIDITADNIRIGAEDTGPYGENLFRFLYEKALPMYTANSLYVAQYKRTTTLRKTKTDKLDTLIIASALRNGNGFKRYTKTDYRLSELKNLTRYRYRIIRQQSKLKIQVRRLIILLFPELEQYFCRIHIGTVYALLERYPGSEQIAKARLETLIETLRAPSKGQYGRDKVIALKDAARHSVGLRSKFTSYELQETIRQIKQLDGLIMRIDGHIEGIMQDLSPAITSVPGIGKVLAASITAEIGDYSRFPDADKLLAFAGLAPTIYQSGGFTATQARIEKRGSKYLRNYLFTAAHTVRQFNPEYNLYYKKKRAEGKHDHVALIHTAKRLVRLFYHLETTHTFYEQNYKKVLTVA